MSLLRLYNLAEATITVPDSSVSTLRKLFQAASKKGYLPPGAERWLNHDHEIEKSMSQWAPGPRPFDAGDYKQLPAPRPAAVKLGGKR